MILEDRLRLNIMPEPNTGCWLWAGFVNVHGYGQLSIKNKPYLAHRVVYEMNKGPIPDGLCALHVCDVRICVNPTHIFLGTRRDNAIDRDRKNRTKSGGGRPKLDKLQIFVIRSLKDSGLKRREIAKYFNMAQSSITDVVNKVNWKHL